MNPVPAASEAEDALLRHVVRRIVEAVDPERIILFGSRAKGTATGQSDVDLCVIVEHGGAQRDVGQRIHSLFRGRPFSRDVIVRSPSEYAHERRLLNSISYFIEKHGKTLYRKAGVPDKPMAEPPEGAQEDWTQQCFEKADRDLRTAKMTREADDPMLDVACYHAQQCVEKCLKGFLTAHRREVEKTHSLTDLLDRCTAVDASFQSLRGVCERLNKYAVEVRYPGASPEPDAEAARAAVEAAEGVRAFVREHLDLNA